MDATPALLVRNARQAAGLTQTELAQRLGTRQPVIARLESPRSNPRWSTIRSALRAAGYEVETTLRPAGSSVDETMIVANLRLTPAERMRRFAESYRGVAELATKARRGGGP